MTATAYISKVTKALFIAGSAFAVYACKSTTVPPSETNNAALITQQSENLTIINTRNGKMAYKATTPILERYDFAASPYMEFRKGVYVEMFNDSTQLVETTMSANYAIYYEKQRLWQAGGNVIVINAKGEKLETEQLFWDEKAKRIYSYVDSKISEDGVISAYGSGFSSDEKMEEWEFRDANWEYFVNSEDLPKRDTSSRSDGPVIVEGEPVAKPDLK